MNTLQINLSQNIIEDNHLCEELEQFMLLNNVTEAQRFKLITCTMEGVNNALQHGGSHANEIIIMLHCNDQKIMVDVLDKANFSPLPDVNECPNIEQENGRGLWIMDNWMDQVVLKPSVLGTHLRLSLLR
ncbi:ATP-binding protein [Shewanella intestini]|uniref:ATP-binding protein n=1 Tax=Shewanella intestini TaxID=2017544 RepID=A0ABS5HZH6_9GAMM|nr:MULTISPECIES: ATP-binding protein [Shewanella]MBR9726824.1 ATP-binding protein [Shewanella intestini]MRG34610.1 ATP-binding protein [Shewanella sp. XMDDZSB0408]